MANEEPFVLLADCSVGLPRSKVSVVLEPLYDRQPHHNSDLEEKIESTWLSRLAKQPSLYNGSKFRFGGACIPSSLPDSTPTTACLHLGLTDYKTFMGTNLSPHWQSLLAPSPSRSIPTHDSAQPNAESATAHADITGSHSRQHLSCPLGNAALVCSSDGYFICLRRGTAVGEAPGLLVFPGGHAEPSEVPMLATSPSSTSAADAQHAQQSTAGSNGTELVSANASCHQRDLSANDRAALNEAVAHEMFVAMEREIEEETGVPRDTLSNMLLVGVCERRENARPVSVFVCDCALSSAAILAAYSDAEHKFESTALLVKPLEELTSAALQMPGCHHGSAVLANRHLLRTGRLKR